SDRVRSRTSGFAFAGPRRAPLSRWLVGRRPAIGSGAFPMSIGTETAVGTGRVTDQPAWKALEAHHRDVRSLDLRELFAREPGRGERLTTEAAGVYLDYSKNRITGDTLRLLVRLAVECGLRARIDAMFGGEKINVSEQRAVLH